MSLSEKIQVQLSFTQQKLEEYLKDSKKIFLSSSFQTHSIPLLHIVLNINDNIPIYFINTGFHFPETILFKNQISELLSTEVLSVVSSMPKVSQKDNFGKFYFCSNPDYCCHINKIAPLEPILMSHDIWITGVRRDQSTHRKQMDFEAKGPFNTMRFHPMLDWDNKMIWEYRQYFNLPAHPLEKEGYLSVGCEPCTQKYIGDDRNGRWKGMKKSECGLHTELIEK